MSVKKLIFQGVEWLPQILMPYEITSIGSAFIFVYRKDQDFMDLNGQKPIPKGTKFSSNGNIKKVTYDFKDPHTGKISDRGEPLLFLQIIKCPTHPEFEGKWIYAKDASKISGAVTASYRLCSKLHCLFRKAVSL